MKFLCNKHYTQGTIVAMAAKMPEVILTKYGLLAMSSWQGPLAGWVAIASGSHFLVPFRSDRYVRREKEIAETKQDLAESENTRHQQKAEHLQRRLEEAEGQLREVTEQARAHSETAAQHAEVLAKVGPPELQLVVDVPVLELMFHACPCGYSTDRIFSKSKLCLL